MYNEEGTIEEFYARVCTALQGLRFELVLVDDGSTDASEIELRKLGLERPRVRVVQLSRNFGHQTALTAGLDHARGDAVVMLDADLQDPPELIPRMLDHWRARLRRDLRGARAARAASRASSSRPPGGSTRSSTGSLRSSSSTTRATSGCSTAAALDALLSMRERNRFLRGMTVWVGYRQAAVPYKRDPRYAGETKYTIPKMLSFSLDAISSFSHRPLQLATLLGFLISTLAFIAIPVVVVLRILGSYLPGFSSMTIAVLLLGGIQLMAIGLIGEYVGQDLRRGQGPSAVPGPLPGEHLRPRDPDRADAVGTRSVGAGTGGAQRPRARHPLVSRRPGWVRPRG